MPNVLRIMQPHTVIGIGELLWDCFGENRRPGGAPANVAYHARQLGMDGGVVSRVGVDDDGDALLAHLAERGLPTQTIQRDAIHATGHVTVDTQRPDHPSYTIHQDVAWDYLEPNQQLEAAVDRAKAICFGTLAQRSARSRATIQGALESADGALRVYDVNLRPPWFSAEIVKASLRRCDVAKLNDQEVGVVAELVGVACPDAHAGAAEIRELFALQAVCVTRAERGCLVLTDRQCVDLPGRRVEVVDAVGAGDAFTAAFVCGLLWEWPLKDTAYFANEVGALVATRRGAMPDLERELTGLQERCRSSNRKH